MQTFECISSTFEDIAGIMGSCRIYEKMHSLSKLESSKAVIDQIPSLYVACLKFIAEAIIYLNTGTTSEFSYVHFFSPPAAPNTIEVGFFRTRQKSGYSFN